MKQLIVLGAILALSGCAAPAKVVEINPGVYSLSVGAMGIEGGEAAAKNKAFAAASAHCAGMGKHLDVQSESSHGPVEWGSAAGSANVVFRCVETKTN